jgi:hypothetical protein
MAIIQFTEEDKRRCFLTGLGSTHPGEIVVRIENAEDCEGLACAERLEMALPEEEYSHWLEFHSEREPLGKHSHLVARGRDPETLPTVMAVFRKPPTA